MPMAELAHLGRDSSELNGQKTGSRTSDHPSLLICAYLLIWPFLLKAGSVAASLNIPATSSRLFITSVALAMLAYLLSWRASRSTSSSLKFSIYNAKLTVFSMTFVALVCVSILTADDAYLDENSQTGFAASIAFFALSVVAIPLYSKKGVENRIYVDCLLLSLPLYVAGNLFFVQMSSAWIVFGTHGRIIKSLSMEGANTIGTVSGLAFVAAFCLWQSRRQRFLGVVLSLTSAVMVFYSGSRYIGLLVAAIMSMQLLPHRKKVVATKLTWAVWPFSALVVLLLVTIADSFGLSDVLSRGANAPVGIATGRDLIWKTGLEILSEFRPSVLFGNGYFGANDPKLRYVFTYVFPQYDYYGLTLTPGMHNATLQMLFDIGIVGAVVFWLTTLFAINLISELSRHDSYYLPFLMLFTFILGLGFTETIGSPYNIETFYMFVALVLIAAKFRVSEYRDTMKNPDS